MILNLFTIKWEIWAKWIEIGSIDIGKSFGALLYIGVVEKEFEWDFLFIKFICRLITWRGVD